MVNKCVRCDKFFEVVPLRAVVGVMMFFGCWVNYMIRTGFNLLLLAMVQPGAGKNHTPECGEAAGNGSVDAGSGSDSTPDYGPRFAWDQAMQGHLLSAHGYGYFVTQLPAGVLADALGAHTLVVWATALMAVGTAVTPLAAQLHWSAIFIARLCVGAGGGCIYPAMHALIARWSPPQEKSKFIWALLGGTLSTVATWPMCAGLSEVFGWRAVFYTLAGIAAIFTAAWALLVRSTPDAHPCIPEGELQMLQDCVSAPVRRVVPLKKVLSSPPALALLFLHFGNLWGLYFFTTEGPKFMDEVLGFNLQQSGIYASLPSLARFGAGLVFSAVGDAVVARGWPQRTLLRKSLITCSHLLPGALLASMALVGCNNVAAITILTVSLGLNGAATVTNLANHHDLAPNFAGSMYGLMNSIGSTTAFIVPQIVGVLLADHNGMQEWTIIFQIGAALYIVSGVVFIFFGSGEVQPWNDCDVPRLGVEPDGIVNYGATILEETTMNGSTLAADEISDGKGESKSNIDVVK